MKNILKLFCFFALGLCFNIGFTTCDNNNDEENFDAPYPFNISAMDFVSGMRVGWNLGNTFDAVGGGSTILQLETGWGNPPTTRENIQAIKNAGFNVIRIPVSWSKVTHPETFIIREDWMMRVMQVVTWAIEEDMYVILNTHHDSGTQGTIFRFLDTQVEVSLLMFGKIWEQIAETFKHFEEKLIFSPLNEPRVGNNWTGHAEAYNNINRHYQKFVDIVRASGANNRYRFLLFTTYAASRNVNAMNGLVLPNDPAKDKHIVSYHAYVPGNFAFGGSSGSRFTTVNWSITGRVGRDALDITEPMDQFYNKFVTRGIPVIIGEFGATNKNNEEDRALWAEFYTRQAWNRGMRVIWWDNGRTIITDTNDELFGLFDRVTNQIIYPKIMEGLLKGSE